MCWKRRERSAKAANERIFWYDEATKRGYLPPVFTRLLWEGSSQEVALPAVIERPYGVSRIAEGRNLDIEGRTRTARHGGARSRAPWSAHLTVATQHISLLEPSAGHVRLVMSPTQNRAKSRNGSPVPREGE